MGVVREVIDKYYPSSDGISCRVNTAEEKIELVVTINIRDEDLVVDMLVVDKDFEDIAREIKEELLDRYYYFRTVRVEVRGSVYSFDKLVLGKLVFGC